MDSWRLILPHDALEWRPKAAPALRYLYMMDPKKASQKMAQQLNNIRHKKVANLKLRIAKGKYRVSNADLAKALFLSQ